MEVLIDLKKGQHFEKDFGGFAWFNLEKLESRMNK